MRDYILSVIAAASISAMVFCLMDGKSTSGKMLRLICGVLMVITVLTPLTKISFDHIASFWNSVSVNAEGYVAQGEQEAKDARNAIIKERSEAYILDKANGMGLEITVEVELDDSNDSIPGQITISGSVSPYAKGVLSEYIADNLGIPKECQQWN